jgi:hypothetical protein
MTPLDAEVDAVARSYVGDREVGKNDGPNVRRWLAHCGRKPGDPYCACFVCCVVHEAGMRVPVLPRMKRTASALRLADLNPGLVIDRPAVLERLRLGLPCVFIIDTKPVGDGKGHCGFGLALADDGKFESVEANTNAGPAAPAKDRDGQGTYCRRDRRLTDVTTWLAVG